MAKRRLRGRLFRFGKEGEERIVECALDSGDRRLFVDDAGREGLVGLGEGLQGSEDVPIGRGWLSGAKFCYGEGDGRQKLRVQPDEIGGEPDIEQGSIWRKRAGMVFFIAVGSKEIGAVRWAIERDFAFGAAADGTDFFSPCRAEAFSLAFLTDGTGQEKPLALNQKLSCRAIETKAPAPEAATKTIVLQERISRHDDFVLKAAGGDDQEERAKAEQG